jgi:hypothetical protein
MKKANSILLIVFGIGLLLIGKLIDHLYLKYSILIASIAISIYAVIKSFEEKKDHN